MERFTSRFSAIRVAVVQRPPPGLQCAKPVAHAAPYAIPYTASGTTRGHTSRRAPVTPHRSGRVRVKPRSTVRSATKRASAGPHIATGANAAHAGEWTVHPIHADSAATAVVVPVEITT